MREWTLGLGRQSVKHSPHSMRTCVQSLRSHRTKPGMGASTCSPSDSEMYGGDMWVSRNQWISPNPGRDPVSIFHVPFPLPECERRVSNQRLTPLDNRPQHRQNSQNIYGTQTPFQAGMFSRVHMGSFSSYVTTSSWFVRVVCDSVGINPCLTRSPSPQTTFISSCLSGSCILCSSE